MSDPAFNEWYDRYFDEATEKYAGLDTTNPKGIAQDAWDAAIEAERLRAEYYINDDRNQLRAEIVELKVAIADLEADRKRRGETVARLVALYDAAKSKYRAECSAYYEGQVDAYDMAIQIVESAGPQPAEPVKRKRRYAQGTALGELGIIPTCDQVDDEPVKGAQE